MYTVDLAAEYTRQINAKVSHGKSEGKGLWTEFLIFSLHYCAWGVRYDFFLGFFGPLFLSAFFVGSGQSQSGTWSREARLAIRACSIAIWCSSRMSASAERSANDAGSQ